MSKTYILVRDLPDCKAGAEFKIAVVEGLSPYYQSSKVYQCYTPEQVEDNPEWFKEKEEPEINLGDYKGCSICGGTIILVRGKHPGDDKREMCPQCTLEKLEKINEISGIDYRKSYNC